MLEKGILFIGLVGSLFTMRYDTIINRKVDSTASVQVTRAATPTNPDLASINTNAIIEEAKKTMEEYNKSVEIRKAHSKRILNLTKIELQNAKKQNALINSILVDFKSKKAIITRSNNVDISDIKSDSICTTYKKPFLGKTKCSQYLVTYYVDINNERINLFNIKR